MKYRPGMSWYGLYHNDTLIISVEPKYIMRSAAHELNVNAGRIGVVGFGWSLLTDEDKKVLADLWMVENFGEDGLQDPITK